jgi:hypothetical protein
MRITGLFAAAIPARFSHLPQPDLIVVRLCLGLTQCFIGNCPAGVLSPAGFGFRPPLKIYVRSAPGI